VSFQTFELPADPNYQKNDQTISAASDTMAMRMTGEVCVQIAGSATAIDATVLRSPDGADDNYSPAGDNITGNPSTGVGVKRYSEPSVAFWKVRVNSITGSAKIHMSGKVGG
jgi:hypothetical protein